jgi:hypothetical protein
LAELERRELFWEVALALAVEVEAGANAEFVDGWPNENLGTKGGMLAGAVEDALENEKKWSWWLRAIRRRCSGKR